MNIQFSDFPGPILSDNFSTYKAKINQSHKDFTQKQIQIPG
ncbi:hypothetical protein ACUXI4_004298 [Pantoea piersonii]